MGTGSLTRTARRARRVASVALGCALFMAWVSPGSSQEARGTNAASAAALAAPPEPTRLPPPVGLAPRGRRAWARLQELLAGREAYARAQGARTAGQRLEAFRRWEAAHPGDMAGLDQMLRDAALEKKGTPAGTSAGPTASP